MNTNHQPPEPSGLIVALALQALEELDKVWGNARLGLLLANAYFQFQPLTSAQLAEQCNVSDDTVRRWLGPLINVDRVRVLREGRNVRYKAREAWATKTRDRLLAIKVAISNSPDTDDPVG